MAKGDVLVRMKADVSNYDANIAKARRQLAQFKNDNLSFGGVMKQTSSSIAGMASRYLGAAAAIGAIGEAMRSNVSTALGFEKSMSQLSSLTGMVGKDLEKLKNYAIELGSSTTLSASQVADAFRMIGSQQPQLLESGEALKAVTKNAITLSEAAGIDLATAAQTLSTSINQMGGDSTKAERYVNVLAAASQKGAGDIAWLGEALTKSATAAKAVGTDYEELVANLEQLAKAGFDASTAGTALRSIIMNLEKQANQDFKPSVVGMTQAFENLNKANMDLTGYQTIAGKMFATQAKVLAEAAGEARKMTDAITGTNIAEEQAKTNTDNLDGSLKSLSSAWEGLNLHINDSNGFLRTCVDWLKDVVVWADQAFTVAGRAQRQLNAMQGGGNGQPTTVDKQIAQLNSDNHTTNWSTYRGQVAGYNKQINQLRDIASKWHEWQDGTISAESKKILDEYRNNNRNASLKWLEQTAGNLEKMRDEYMSRALEIIKPKKPATETDNPTPGSGGGSDKNKNKNKNKTIKTEEQLNNEEIQKLTQEYIHASEQRQAAIRDEIKVLQERNELIQALKDQAQGKGFDPTKIGPIADLTGRVPVPDFGVDMKRGKNGKWYDATAPVAPDTIKFSDGLQKRMDYEEKQRNKYSEKKEVNLTSEMSKIAGGVSGIFSGIESLGVELPQGLKDVMGGIQGVISIMTSISTILSAIEAINAADTLIPFARGGIVKAAGGTIVGNSYSGDNLRGIGPGGQLYGLNASEVVLNRAQQGNLVSQLEGANGRSVNVRGVLQGEQIFLAAERWSKRTGKGEIVTW